MRAGPNAERDYGSHTQHAAEQQQPDGDGAPEEPWSTAAAAKDIAFTRLDALEAAKKLNRIEGWSLAAAMSSEALAVGCVAVAVGYIL